MTCLNYAVRGYAIPFLQCARVAGGQLEYVAPEAFKTMLAAPSRVFLNACDHGAPAISVGRVTLFADAYGLGFEGVIDHANDAGVMFDVRRGAGCSVGGLNILESEIDVTADGERARRIVSATIKHITITREPAYLGTGAWAPDLAGGIPTSVKRLAAHWEAGKRRQDTLRWVHAEMRKRKAARPQSHYTVTTVSGKRVRFPFPDAIVNSMARAIAAGRFQNGVVFGMPSQFMREAERRAARIRGHRG